MKVRTRSLLVGAGIPLILTGAADAAFTGISVTGKPNAYGLLVCNVYAEFDNPGHDWMQAVVGAPHAPLSITVISGTFWNHPSGGETGPTTSLVGLFPSLAYDSFYTLGLKTVAGGVTDATNLVNLPSLAGTSIHTSGGSWGLVPPTSAQGNPFDPINSFPGGGRILIGQFATADGSGVIGTFLLQYLSDGTIQESVEQFEHIVPAPGVLGVVGLAGLLSPRRRRR